MKKYLMESANAIGISLSDRQLEQFSIFYEHLIETNKSLNLTAITEMHEVVIKHFVDSIAVTKYVDLSGKKVIDIGTGAGFPGIPLAILLPDTQFTLMDSLNKRLHFIEQVKEMCGIENVETVHSRAEDLGQNPAYREQYDFCVSRAVAALPVLLEYCIPFVKKGGMFISYKSEMMDEEIKQSENAQKILKCKLKETYSFTLPESEYYRTFAVFEKTDILQKKYPRQAGKPKRNPL